MGKLLLGSVVGNLLLALSAYFLFVSNTKLNVTKGEQSAAISGYMSGRKDLVARVNSCVDDQVKMAKNHKAQINGLKDAADRMAKENREQIETLLVDRGRLQILVRTIQKPTDSENPQERIDKIEKMVNSYIEEKNK